MKFHNDLNQLTIIRNGNSADASQIENYTYDPFGQRVKIERNDTAATVIYTPFKEFMLLFLFTFFISILIIPFVSASVETLTYDYTTNQLNMSYDSLNRILNKSSTTENITYTYDDEYDGTLTMQNLIM